MRAILVCVEYEDYLSLTLPYNRHHFDEVMVVTTENDLGTHRVAARHGAKIFTTSSFYSNGAYFNKWAALEEGLEAYGRHGLIAIMDADIVWPKNLPCTEFQMGNLYTPFRRICPVGRIWRVPEEIKWRNYRQKKDKDFVGYTQIFHAEDPVLPPPPWHELDWMHAGGGDYGFQNLWPTKNKIRPRWEVLHLGTTSKNWCGRVTQRLDGKKIEGLRQKVRISSEVMLKHQMLRTNREK